MLGPRWGTHPCVWLGPTRAWLQMGHFKRPVLDFTAGSLRLDLGLIYHTLACTGICV